MSCTLRWRQTAADFQDADRVSVDAEATTAGLTPSEDGEYQVELQGNVGDDLLALASAHMQEYAYRPCHLALYDRSGCGPNRITGIQADPVNGVVEVRWKNPNNPVISKYQYQTQHGITFDLTLDVWTDAGSTDATTTLYTVTGLDNGERYGLILRAVAGSKTYCFNTLIWVTPSDPTVERPPVPHQPFSPNRRPLILPVPHLGGAALVGAAAVSKCCWVTSVR